MRREYTFQACPDFKGIKTAQGASHLVLPWFQACPDFKGIKTSLCPIIRSALSFKLALISKGLRLCAILTLGVIPRFQACPDFKGIKTYPSHQCPQQVAFQACPDFKGIKTRHCVHVFQCKKFQACPDFKGIKTATAQSSSSFLGFKLALISKGLRLHRMNRQA